MDEMGMDVDNIEELEVEQCCGATLLCGFGLEEDPFKYRNISKKNVENYVSDVKDRVSALTNRLSNPGVVQLYLNECQKKHFDKMFLSIGFEQVAWGCNKNSNSKVFLYAFQRKSWVKRKKAA